MAGLCKGRGLAAVLLAAILLFGCQPAAPGVPTCNVVFEDSPTLFFYRQIYPVTKGDDLTVSIGVPTGQRITAVNYDRYSLSGKTGYSASYDYYTLILHNVRYPVVIRLETGPAYTTVYHLGDGQTVTVEEQSPRLTPNTLPYQAAFAPADAVALGWNTAPDGSGTHVGFGSQLSRTAAEVQDLYLETAPCTAAEHFTWAQVDGAVTVTGYTGSGENLVLPATIEGLPVTAIAAGAFGEITADTVVLPPTLRQVEDGAFSALRVENLYLFDTLESVSDASFGDVQAATLHINAARPPVYSGSYFDTLSEKFAYLHSLAGQRKLVLFCGSSARFGYDSPLLEAAFPDYRVVNMGVYAYANMLPQAMLLLSELEEGDIVLSSPELDAIDRQFCGHTELDKETFCMLESNYDLLARLDCRRFIGIFDAFAQYQAARSRMAARSYNEVPAQYDEDGNRQEQMTYNRYGDYIVYRPNNQAGKNFGVKRAYYNAAYITPADWQGLNAVYDAFAAKGAQVLFTWSPRSRTSLSDDSTAQTMAALDELARATLHARVISPIEASLMDPLYFFGTDNHLSTEGVQLHTRQIIADLRTALEVSP